MDVRRMKTLHSMCNGCDNYDRLYILFPRVLIKLCVLNSSCACIFFMFGWSWTSRFDIYYVQNYIFNSKMVNSSKKKGSIMEKKLKSKTPRTPKSVPSLIV